MAQKVPPKLIYMSDEEFRYRITHAGRLNLNTLLVREVQNMISHTDEILRSPSHLWLQLHFAAS